MKISFHSHVPSSAILLAGLTLISTLALGRLSAQAPAAPAPVEMTPEAIEEKLGITYKTGRIALPGDLATLSLGPEFKFIEAKGAEDVLTKLWGNPPGEGVLGMILPAKASPARSGDWAVVVSYEDSGHVEDKDASTIDYSQLLKEMQSSSKEVNEERAKQGYPAVEIVGWATPPRYDGTAKKLYWAKELAFAGEEEHTLNYNIRVLGRKGVLILNAVASIGQLAEVQAATPKLLPMVEFNAGQRYEDFKPGVDQAAAYGIAGLIAGGIAAKAGLFKGLIALLLVGKKFVIIGVVALGAFIKRLFRRSN